MMQGKQPRDFVHFDGLVEGDSQWDNYFIGTQHWMFYDEYRAELPGDQDYCRIIVHTRNDQGLVLLRPLREKRQVERVFSEISKPISKCQLLALGFTAWTGGYDDFMIPKD